jgi:hypothetical protein
MDDKSVQRRQTNDKMDAITAVVLIGVIVTGVLFWLYSMPS